MGEAQIGSFVDERDGQKYLTVKMPDGKVWMAQNLNYKPSDGYGNEVQVYDGNEANRNVYGLLYSWEAASYCAPKGWHLPSQGEWDNMTEAACGKKWVGQSGVVLKSKWCWKGKLFNEGKGKDLYGFSALPGGGHNLALFNTDIDGGAGLGEFGTWWTSTPDRRNNENAIWMRLFYDARYFTSESVTKYMGCSVRCVQSAAPQIGRFVDERDGQEYRTVKIGNKVWMAENLKYSLDGSWCYENNESNCEKYGRLYTWELAKRACPSGWHLPTREEWADLANIASGGWGKQSWMRAGERLKSKIGWKGGGHDGTDHYGFSALPGGIFNGLELCFVNAGLFGCWWTATEHDGNKACSRAMSWEDNHLAEIDEFIKTNGCSVRCVQD